jgi:hypothetical protein
MERNKGCACALHALLVQCTRLPSLHVPQLPYVVLLPHHVPLPCQSYARDEQKGCTYLCMKRRLDKSKEVYEAARAAVCIAYTWTKWNDDAGRWEEHIPVKRHCCCDGRCGLAAAGDDTQTHTHGAD